MTVENYEVENPQIQSTLREIGSKIGGSVPAGWGFLLMLFEYGAPEHPGANFYVSSAERDGVIRMVQEWLSKQAAPTSDEINPLNPLVQQARNNWHKIVALLLMKMGAESTDEKQRAVITPEEIATLGQRDVAVALKEESDGLHVFLVDTEEARKLAAQGLAEEGSPA